jgi:hypothetical protein
MRSGLLSLDRDDDGWNDDWRQLEVDVYCIVRPIYYTVQHLVLNPFPCLTPSPPPPNDFSADHGHREKCLRIADQNDGKW